MIEDTLKRMYSLFDSDKNGILDINEIIAAMSILCKGSFEQKINLVFATFGGKDGGFTF